MEVNEMVRPRRYLYLPDLDNSRDPAFAAAQEDRFAACPEAAGYSDHEVEDFLCAAFYLDYSDRLDIVKSLQKIRMPIPPEIIFDEYRLTRFLFRRWREVAEAFLQGGMQLDWGRLAQLRRRCRIDELVASADVQGAPVVLCGMRRFGMNHFIPAFMAALTPAENARHRTLMLSGRLLLHRCLTEPEPPRTPSPWERQKLNRRLRLREVQLRAMRHSQRRLSRERRELLDRLRSAGQKEQPELAALAAELAAIRAQRTAARQRHEAAMAEQAASGQRTLSRLQASLAGARVDYAGSLEERARWLPAGGRLR
jgi:hypothetical protein